MRVSLLAVATALVALVVVAVAGAAPAFERATTDRPDEVFGPQIHAIYAVASDGADAGLDTSGSFGSWFVVFNQWLALQTGGTQVRVDTLSGSPDVSFLRLPQSSAQLAVNSDTAMGIVRSDLAAAGFVDPSKKYVVALAGVSTEVCGEGSFRSSPALIFVDKCPGVRWHFVVGHEIFHMLGAVSNCGAHASNFHVNDNSADLMWPFAQALDTTPLLDPGHDDYWGPPGDDHLPASCLPEANVVNSPWLTSHPVYRILVTGAEHGSIQLKLPDDITEECTADEPCSEIVDPGTVVQVAPDPEVDYRFTGWTGIDCDPDGCSLTVNANTTIGATFAPNPHLALTVAGTGRVVVSDLGTSCSKRCDIVFPYQQATRLRAVAPKGWRIAGWSGACHGSAPLCTLTLSDDSAATVRFAKLPPVCGVKHPPGKSRPCRRR